MFLQPIDYFLPASALPEVACRSAGADVQSWNAAIMGQGPWDDALQALASR